MRRCKRPVLDSAFWRERLAAAMKRDAVAGDALHESVMMTTRDHWQAIEARHRLLLARHVMPWYRVLDAGCAYGRLVEMLPSCWQVFGCRTQRYMGVDLSPDFVALARARYPDWRFVVGDLRALCLPDESFDLAVTISMRGMIRRECGEETWQQMQAEILRVARRLLVLEYDPEDEGEIINGR